MKEKLTALLNTLVQVETKGDSTLKMAGCLQYVQQMIEELDAKKVENKDMEK